MLGDHAWFRPIPVAAVTGVLLVAPVVLTLMDSARARPGARLLLALSLVGMLVVTLLASSD